MPRNECNDVNACMRIRNVATKISNGSSAYRVVSRTALHHARCTCRTDIYHNCVDFRSLGGCIVEVGDYYYQDCQDCKECKECDPVCSFTERAFDYVSNGIPISYDVAIEGFVTLVLSGLAYRSSIHLDDGQRKYDLSRLSMNDAYCLLQLFGAENSDGKYILFPYLRHHDWGEYRLKLHNAELPIPNKFRETVLVVLNSPGGPGWQSTKLMLRQLLVRLVEIYPSPDNYRRARIDLARSAYNAEQENINDPV